jgi:nitrate reductase delta subunit
MTPAAPAGRQGEQGTASAGAGGSREVYKIISLLLQYPTAELLAQRGFLMAVVCGDRSAHPDGSVLARQMAAIGRFLAHGRTAGAIALQQEYVRTFDFQKRASLYLTFSLFGDRRQRGMALLLLKKRYSAAGLPLASKELPDYLPLMLEFAAFAPAGYGEEILCEFRAGLELLRLYLHDADSAYALLLDAVCLGLPALTAEEQEGVRRLAAEGPPAEQVGLEPFAPREVMPAAMSDATSRSGLQCGGAR